MFLTSKKTASYISEFDTVDHDMLSCQWAGTSETSDIQNKADLLGLTSNYV